MCPWVTKNLSSKYLILGELGCILCTVALGALGEMHLWNVVTIGLNKSLCLYISIVRRVSKSSLAAFIYSSGHMV